MIMESEPSEYSTEHRNLLLQKLVSNVPYVSFLGVKFEQKNDDLIVILPFNPKLIGNPALPALHGGVTASFLEITAIFGLSYSSVWKNMNPNGKNSTEIGLDQSLQLIPKTIDFTVDYLRSGLPKDAYAKAEIKRAGRRYASVHVEAWQDKRSRLFAQASGHFLMPVSRG